MSKNHAERYLRAVQGRQSNDPPIVPNQRWCGYDKNGKIFRQVRILAIHPDTDEKGQRKFIYETTIGPGRGNLGITPEFNLRYVFEVCNGRDG